MRILTLCFWLVLAAISANAQCKSTVDLYIISQIESNHTASAYNPAKPMYEPDDSFGRWQITTVCMRAYNRSHLTEYTVKDLYNESVNYKIAYWYINQEIPRMLQEHGFKVTNRNVIVAYNAGIKYVVKKRKIPQITQDYIKKYNLICAQQGSK